MEGTGETTDGKKVKKEKLGSRGTQRRKWEKEQREGEEEEWRTNN